MLWKEKILEENLYDCAITSVKHVSDENFAFRCAVIPQVACKYRHKSTHRISACKLARFRGDVFEAVRNGCKQILRVRVTSLFPRLTLPRSDRHFRIVRSHGSHSSTSSDNTDQEEGFKTQGTRSSPQVRRHDPSRPGIAEGAGRILSTGHSEVHHGQL